MVPKEVFIVLGLNHDGRGQYADGADGGGDNPDAGGENGGDDLNPDGETALDGAHKVAEGFKKSFRNAGIGQEVAHEQEHGHRYGIVVVNRLPGAAHVQRDNICAQKTDAEGDADPGHDEGQGETRG